MHVDHVARAEELGALVDRLAARRPRAASASVPSIDEFDPDDPGAGGGRHAPRSAARTAPWPAVHAHLPECGGLLFEAADGDLLHFRCHVGHAFSEETLLAAQSDALEGALWGAVRALEEKAELARRLAERARGRGMPRAAAGFDRDRSGRRARLEHDSGDAASGARTPARWRLRPSRSPPTRNRPQPTGRPACIPA